MHALEHGGCLYEDGGMHHLWRCLNSAQTSPLGASGLLFVRRLLLRDKTCGNKNECQDTDSPFSSSPRCSLGSW